MTTDGASSPLLSRECGECNACCSALLVDEPTLKKPPNILCEHWKGGCQIYESRPHTCRDFFCGWRLSSNFGENWRPDRSNILVRVLARSPRVSVVFHLLGPLTEEVTLELLNAIGAMIASGNEAFLAVAGGPGESAIRFSLNPAMAQAVSSRDMDAARTILNFAIQECTERPKERSQLHP